MTPEHNKLFNGGDKRKYASLNFKKSKGKDT